MARRGEPLEKVAVAPTEAVGRLWLAVLHQGGVFALLRNVDALSISSMAALPLPYSYELWVLAGQAPRARRLLGLGRVRGRAGGRRPRGQPPGRGPSEMGKPWAP